MAFFQHNRTNIFKDHLKQIQGKGDSHAHLELNENLLSIIQSELSGKEITELKIKKIMKQNHFQCYYELIPAFLKYFNQPVINFTHDEEEKLCLLFERVSNKFNELFPGVSFFNYNYIIYKLVEHIEHPDLHLIYIKFESEEKIKYCDSLWKQICENLDMPFISSIDE